jgi:small multidrug resistance pump
MFVLYGLSFVPMTIALKEMEIGAVYAIWSAVGTAVVAVLGVLVFHEPANLMKAVAITLIIAGVVCLNISTPHRNQTATRSQTELRSELRLQNPTLVKTASTSATNIGAGAVRPATGR